jgi:hypothetical protein
MMGLGGVGCPKIEILAEIHGNSHFFKESRSILDMPHHGNGPYQFGG